MTQVPTGEGDAATTSRRLYLDLCHEMVVGNLGPGSALSLRAIAERYGTSMTPARDAVARLAADGLITFQPNRAIRIPDLDDRQIEAIWRLRLMLECEAADRAARHATAEVVATIRAAHETVAAALAGRDVVTILLAVHKFGLSMAQASGDELLLSVITNVRLRSAPHVARAFHAHFESIDSFRGYSLAVQGLMIEALERGDPESTSALRWVDLQSFKQFILDQRGA